MTASSILLRRGSSSYSIFGKWTAGSSCFFSRGAHQLSTGSGAVISSPSRLQNTSPWLMLPSAFEGVNNTMSYKFYSLLENKVLTLGGSGDKEVTDLMSNRNLRLRGSSCGWIALFNMHNLDLFLYNPISRRHLKLPPIRNLPQFPINDLVYSRSVNKLVLSCSPDEDEENCRALIIYNTSNSLAFCCPGRSKQWTPIGEPRVWDERRGRILTRRYRDCVYSTREKLFFGITNFGEVESWDLQDPSLPRMIKEDEGKLFTISDQYRYKYDSAREHVVVAELDILVVTQYVAEDMSSDGSYGDYDEGSGNWPYMTNNFNIQKYDPGEGDFKYADTLGGLALFLGARSESVALPATEYPYLKPNSIYFTDPLEIESYSCCGNDIGIFNYEDKTVSPCYYSRDVQSFKKITPPPMWFFPSQPVGPSKSGRAYWSGLSTESIGREDTGASVCFESGGGYRPSSGPRGFGQRLCLAYRALLSVESMGREVPDRRGISLSDGFGREAIGTFFSSFRCSLSADRLL